MYRSKPLEDKVQHNNINIMRAVRALLNGTVLVLMLSVALLLPSMSIARLHIQRNTTDSEEYCSEGLAFVQHSLTYSFHGVSFFTNTVVALTRFLMVFFTVMIGVMWGRVKPSTKDHNRQKKRYSKVLTDKIDTMQMADYQIALVSSDSAPLSQDSMHQTNPQLSGHEANPQEPRYNETSFQELGDEANSQDPGYDNDEINPQEQSGHEANSQKPGNDNDQTNSGHNANEQNSAYKADDWETVCCRHTDYIMEYTAIKENVFPIYKIFRSFFVLQWIIHLFGLFSHIAQLLRPWVRNGQVDDANMLIVTHQIYELLHVLYNGLALVISYICALKMNAYLRRYVRKVQERQLEEGRSANSAMQYSLTHLFLIKVQSVSKSSFLPRIPGTGLNISVESPGFVLSIVFSVFALIGTLISF